MPTGLVSWWQAEGNANDSSGLNNGTLQGGATFASGEVGAAFSFVNGTGYVSVPDSPSLALGANDFTIELWANFTSSGGSQALIAKDNGGGMLNKWIFWLNNGVLQFLVNTTTGQAPLGNSSFNPAPNTWYHLAVTRAGWVYSFYVNGSLAVAATNPLAIPPISAPLTIGSAEDGFFMGGLEDEVTLYSRALSAAEIQGIYNAGSAGKCGTPEAPLVLTQPQPVTVFIGTPVSFGVTAAGTPPLAYQWQLNGTNLPGGTSNPLTINHVQTSQAGTYSVVVSDSAGSTNSMGALLTVLTPGTCVPPPQGLVSWWAANGTAADSDGLNNGTLQGATTFAPGEVGGAFSFVNGNSYVSVPDSPSLQLGNQDFTIDLWANFTIVTGNRALIAKDDGAGVVNKWIFWLNNGQLQFAIGSPSAQQSIGTGTLNVTPNTWHHLAVTRAGSLFSFYMDGSVVSTGTYGGAVPVTTAPLTIGQAENAFFMGGLEDEVTIYSRALSAADIQDIYSAAAVGKCSAELTPVIVVPPQTETVAVGTTASFSVTAGGSPPLTYQWQLNGSNISGATGNVLTLTNVQANQAGSYSVIVSNPAGSSSSPGASLNVLTPGSCLPPPSGLVSWWAAEGNALDSANLNNGTLAGGASFAAGEVNQAFSFAASGSYVSVPDSPSLALDANDFTIELWANFNSVAGSQALIAKDNGPGNTSKWIFWLNGGQLQFLVASGASQTSLGSGAFNPTPGTWHHLAISRAGSLFSFYVDGALISTDTYGPAIPTISAPLTIGAAEGGLFMGGLEDEVTLYSRALNASEIEGIYLEGSAGKCSTDPPVIGLQPAPDTVSAGATLTLTVRVTGRQPLNYQWSFNGTNLQGATGNPLILNNIQPGQTGNYSVMISNAAGSTNSASALVTVLPAGACLPAPAGIVSWWEAEGSAADTIGGNGGSWVGGPAFAPGEVGQAFSFVSGTAYVSVPNSPGLQLGTNDFTIELWANFASINLGQTLIAKDDGAGNNNKWLFWLVNEQLQFLILNGASQSPLGTVPFNPAPNTWHHLAVTRSGSLFSIYIDGALASTGTYNAAIPTTTAPLTMGAAEGGLYLGGLEDEVTLYSRALNATEIQAIYNLGSAGKCGPLLPPVVETQPQAQTVLAGTTISLDVLAGGSEPLAYQWELNGTNISGATSSLLTLTNVQLNQAGNYSVFISNAAGTTNSSSAMLTVYAAGACLPAPAGIVSWWAAEGDALDSEGLNSGTLQGGAAFAPGEVNQAFSFAASGSYVSVPDSPSLTLGGSDFSIELWANFSSVGGNRALIAKDNGGGSVNKWIFWLNSGQLQFLVGAGFSQISLGAGAFNPAPNTWHHLAVTRAGSLFSFYVDGALISTATYSATIPAISAPLTIGAAEGGLFMGGLEDEVTLYNRALNAAEIQAIYVVGSGGKCGPMIPPVVLQQPQSQTVFAGDTVAFSVQAGGSQPLNYQWELNGTNIPTSTNATAGTATLILTDVQPADSGNYSVLVSNSAGSTNSTTAQLNIQLSNSCAIPPGVVSWWMAEGNALDHAGANPGILQGGAGFAAGEAGQAFAFTNGTGYVQVPDSPSLNFGANDFTIELWANFASSSGSLALIAKDNGPGQNNKWIFWLTGGQLQFLMATTASSVTLDSGAFSPTPNTWYHLAVTRSGSAFSLYVNGALISSGTSGASIPAISAPLTIGEAENGFYMGGLEDEVTIYSRALSGLEIQNIYLLGAAGKCSPEGPPVVLAEPAGETVYAGTTVSLAVQAGSPLPVTYQWQFNGTNISAATNPTAATSTLTLNNVQVAQTGNYSAVVGNTVGSTNSSNALLTVLTPGSCLPPPSGVVSWWPGEGTANDLEANNSGMLEGAAGFAAGEVGVAFDFSKGSGYVQVPDSPGLNFGANDFTIELWADFTSLGGSRALIAKDNGAGYNNKWIFWLNGGQLQFLVGTTSSSTSIGSGALNPALNTWHHLAVSRAGTLISLYVDGAPSSTGTYNGVIPAITAPLTIGQAEGGNFMGGLEDEVTIYSRALSGAEIQSIYEAGTNGKCSPPMPPFIVAQPQNQAVFAGATVSFSTLAGGTQPLTYQWQFSGTNIPAVSNATAATATLVLTNAQPGQSGTYSVLVSNSAGSTNSAGAQLLARLPDSCSVPPGVVSWWTAEDTATDSTGTNEGTLIGGAAFAAGEVGQAFAFNGAGYVQVPDSPSLNFGANDFAIELWADFNSLNGIQALIAKDNGPGLNNKWIFWLNNGNLQFFMETGGSSVTAVSTAFNPGLNTFHHLAVTRAGSLFSIYVDGALISTGTSSTPIPPIAAPLTIGAAESTFFMNGLEDEVTIYSRALGAAEIQTIYLEGSGGKCGPPLPPFLVTQPQAQSVFLGSLASFSVVAGGSPPLTYQWQFNGTNISTINSTNGPGTLVLKNVQPGQAGNYTVIVSNNIGTTNSIPALLTVKTANCVDAPAGIAGWWAGEGNALDSAGTNHGVLVNGARFAPGLVGQAFSLVSDSEYVDVRDAADLDPTTSVTVEAWINPATFPASAPIIKKAGQGSSTANGYTLELGGSSGVLFGVFVNGTWVVTSPAPVPLSQWTHVAGVYDGTNAYVFVNGQLVGTPVHAPGTITPSANDLQIGHDPSNPSRYFLGLIDEATVYDTALSSAQILAIYNANYAGKCPIPLPPSIALQPQGQSVVLGSSASFTVLAGGSAPLGYQWQFNQGNILPSANSTANNSTLVLTNVQAADAGAYSVIVTNGLGATNSVSAQLTVLFPPSFTLQPYSQLARPGCTVTFTAGAAGTGTLRYQWEFDGSDLPSQTAASLTLVGVQATNFGNYTMVVTNAYGTATSAVAVLSLDHLPVPGSVIVQRFPGAGLRMDAVDLLAGATDADGDPLSLAGVAGTSIEGGNITVNGSSIYYLPPAGLAGADAFTYTISDGHCNGTSVGAVLVLVRTDMNTASRVNIHPVGDGSVQVIFDGMPGTVYRIQSTATLSPPNWQDVTSLPADDYGTYIYIDWPASNGPVRFFRSVTP